MDDRYIFRTTDTSTMIEGCKFAHGVYITTDETKAESLRKSKLFNQTVFEEKVAEPEPEPEPEKKPEPKPKPTVKGKGKKK